MSHSQTVECTLAQVFLTQGLCKVELEGQKLCSILSSVTPHLATTSHSLDLGLHLSLPQLATLHTLI